ncbi:MAG: rhomboid family intramembrane serine protease [Anaerolineae bacterium]|nr:rhomboid family intramembrane serine protease [Anaerolineae bacterium]
MSWLFIVINVLVFVYELSLGSDQLQQFFNQFGVVPVQVVEGENLVSLITSMFLHGGWLHIIGNMLFLFVFGDNVEAVMGKPLYFVFYLVGGLAASAGHILFNMDSTTPSLGASGAIAAVLGAYVVMFPRARIRVLVFLLYFVRVTRVTAVLFVGVWFLTQFLYGVASLGAESAQTAGVAYWAHIGGFVLGLAGGIVFRRRAQSMGLQRA